ncbi:uncharacterized protein TRIADDRAFT_60471 [Trichoplax adhaerens]|uniref:Uncharacterized protein n=1 Tax=Trichoplax adhaerens TaxID=10228 RepID=B3S8A8_TRIAD|nr:predicted protein [Trichoplax adhaerens]EDV21069.1 predicted protein [Trichoplax adhaerens]|eukprot:XP_002116399.1 predicted protein [Trichoplax adhaerens]
MELPCEPQVIQEVTCTSSSPKMMMDENDAQECHESDSVESLPSENKESEMDDSSQLAVDASLEHDESMVVYPFDGFESKLVNVLTQNRLTRKHQSVCLACQTDYSTWSNLAWRYPNLKLEYQYDIKLGYGEIWFHAPLPSALYRKLINYFGYTLVSRICHKNISLNRFRYYGVGPCDILVHGQPDKLKTRWPDRGFEPIGLKVGVNRVLPRSVRPHTFERYGTTPLPTLVLEIAYSLENEDSLIQELMNWVHHSSVQIAVGIVVIKPDDDTMIWPMNAYVVRNTTKALEKFSTLDPAHSIMQFKIEDLFYGMDLPFCDEEEKIEIDLIHDIQLLCCDSMEDDVIVPQPLKKLRLESLDTSPSSASKSVLSSCDQ